MKKLYTLLAACFLTASAFAQLPDGSVAPNFTTTDIHGNTVSLYSILDQGKSVVMDISASWCAPCWAYHNTKALDNLYADHGPAGDNKVEVLWVEGDAKTSVACISGLTGCTDAGGHNPASQGDWTAGVDYSIIDDASISNAYALTYYPTIYLICPDRTVTEIGQKSATLLWDGASQCQGKSGVNNGRVLDFTANAPFTEICGTVPAAPEFTMMNMGDAAMKSAQIYLKWKGNTIQTVNWTGNLNTFSTDHLVFDQITVDQAGDLEVAIGNVNGAADDDNSNNSKVATFVDSKKFSTQKIYLKIKTDAYANELYWELQDDQGNEVDHGGNVAVGIDGGGQGNTNVPSSPTAYANNATIRDTLVLPKNGCYSIHFVDYFGDGMGATGYYKMYNLGNTVTTILDGGQFAAYDHRLFGTNGFLSAEELFVASEFDVYPNPTTSALNVDFMLSKSADVQVTITNAIGQTVQTEARKAFGEGFHPESVQLNNLPNGLYFLNLNTAEGSVSKKFVVQK